MIGTGKVDSILKYNGIGFDMDHTFIRYKMKNFVKLINQSMSIYLVSKQHYPQEIFPDDEKDMKQKHKMWFRAVFDHKTGNLLKIGSNNLILRGYHGFTPLTKEQIHKTYGKNPLIDNYEILSSRHKDFTNLHEFYGAALVPLLAQIVELKSTGKYEILNKKSYYDINADIVKGCDYNYNIDDIQKFKENEFHGYFYPKLLTEPRHYVYKTSLVLIEKLKKLKAKGIKIFIISNNYYDVGNRLMTEAMGSNWMDLFDFVIYRAMKPAFFKDETEITTFLDLQGKPINNFKERIETPKCVEDKVFAYGHAELLNQYFRENVRKDFSLLFFGDTIVSDCVYAFHKTQQKYWNSVFIMEELQEIENSYPDGEYSGYWCYWGSALIDKHIYSGVDNTIVFEFADNTAHRTFSKLDSPDCLEFLTI